MSFEQVDHGQHDRFDNRILGSVGDTRHTITGPTPIGTPARPQLSLVPAQTERYEVAPATIEDDQWQERAIVRSNRPRGVLPREGRLDPRGQANLPGLRGAGPVPGVRAGPRRALRHLGRPFRAGASPPQARDHLTLIALQVLLVVDRRVDDRRFDAQIRGHLSHQDFMQQLGEFDGVFRPSLDRLAEQHNSRTGALPRTSTPAGISRASAIGPSATTSGGHCTARGLSERSAESRRRRRRVQTPDPANAARSVRRPRAPPCRTARPGCASPAPSAEAAGRAFPGRGVIRVDSARHEKIVTVGDRARRPRVSPPWAGLSHDSLSFVNVPRRCCRPGCPHYAVATLTFVYSDSTAVVGPLATVSEPHSWDLCVATPAGSPRRAVGSWSATRGRCLRIRTRTIWSRWPTRYARGATSRRRSTGWRQAFPIRSQVCRAGR
jgi:hypothetical protein